MHYITQHPARHYAKMCLCADSRTQNGVRIKKQCKMHACMGKTGALVEGIYSIIQSGQSL